jgi:hypothetical protein
MAEALVRSIALPRVAALDLVVVAMIWAGVMIAGLCVLVAICLRGTRPSDRPAVLYALASIVRALRTSQRHGGRASRPVDKPAIYPGGRVNRKRRPRGPRGD